LRTIQLVFVSLLATAALASASAGYSWEDEAGDETMTIVRADPSAFGTSLEDCHNEAADIRVLEFATSDVSLTFRLTMASLADLESDCTFFSPSGARGEYEVSWREILSDTDVSGIAGGIRASAETTGFGIKGCINVQDTDPNVLNSGCVGTTVQEGDSIVWTMPITDTQTVEVCDDASCVFVHEEERTYDFRGFTGDVSGSSDVRLQNQISFFGDSFTDFVSGDIVTG
jgi:hypothetical protein